MSLPVTSRSSSTFQHHNASRFCLCTMCVCVRAYKNMLCNIRLHKTHTHRYNHIYIIIYIIYIYICMYIYICDLTLFVCTRASQSLWVLEFIEPEQIEPKKGTTSPTKARHSLYQHECWCKDRFPNCICVPCSCCFPPRPSVVSYR